MKSKSQLNLVATLTVDSRGCFKDSPHGYQVGAAEQGTWFPLVICSTRFRTVQQALDAAEAQLVRAERAVERRRLRNAGRGPLIIGRPSVGPGAA